MLRVTADSNIYILALHFGGSPDRVLELARAGFIQLGISEFILGEVSRVLLEKFDWDENRVASARALIAGFAERVTPTHQIDAVSDDPSDNRILECAAANESQYLVTGDRHLLKLGRFEKVEILTASRFLEICSGA